MKCEAKKPEVKFQPIELTITIDSSEELAQLKEFLGWNVTVPNIFKSNKSSISGMEEFTFRLMKYMADALTGQS